MKSNSILNRCLLVWMAFSLTVHSLAQLTGQPKLKSPAPLVFTHITSFSPTSATGGTLVAIRGVGFTGTTSVKFGVVPALTFTVLSDTMISARVGSGASGAVYVSGTHGHDSLAGFTYIIPPPLNLTDVRSFSPTSGTTGTSIFIFGTGFTQTNTVEFGGTAAQSFTVLSDTAITAIVGTGSSGSVFVSGLLGHDSLAGFTYLPSPDSLTPQPSLSVYPNPASSFLSVTVPHTARTARVQLTDISGRISRSVKIGTNVTNVTINLAGLNRGIYKLVWNDGLHSSQQTILISK